MNELLTLVHDFNTKHKADAFFNYAGHVGLVHVFVNAPNTVYEEGVTHNRIFDAECWIDKGYTKYVTIEALTEAFRAFAESYHEQA